MASFRATFDTGGVMTATMEKVDTLTASFNVVWNGNGHEYHGPYVVTPTRQYQSFNTAYTFMEGDFVVNPIPPNYGLITWDGNTLTVS